MELIAQRDFGAPLLGLEFDRAHGKVYITNVGDFAGTGSKIQRVAAISPSWRTFAVILADRRPGTANRGQPGRQLRYDHVRFRRAAVPNALVFDKSGNLYISDFVPGGRVKITTLRAARQAAAYKRSVTIRQLATAGSHRSGPTASPSNSDESALFVANTGDDGC